MSSDIKTETKNHEMMNRRGFFKRSLVKMTKASSEYVEQKVVEKAKGWIRPPFAQTEFDFLLNCSRCGDCIDACPHDVIFPLPIQRGASVAGTPAMDIPNNACHLCTDWPCVTSCKDNALSFSVAQLAINTEIDQEIIAKEKEEVSIEISSNESIQESSAVSIIIPQPKDCPPLASARINKDLCMPYSGPECGACQGSCPIPDTLIWHNEKPSINLASCIGCGLCVQTCITSPKAIEIMSYQAPDESNVHLKNSTEDDTEYER